MEVRRNGRSDTGSPSPGPDRRTALRIAGGLGALALTSLAGCTLPGREPEPTPGLLTSSPSPEMTPLRPGRSSAGYLFEDDFDGPAGSPPDPGRWVHDVGGGGWGNQELQDYTDSTENSFQDGEGNLVIRATAEHQVSEHGTEVSYRSARLTTRGRFAGYTGTFEARIRMAPRTGYWPAWWALGADHHTVGWPDCGEIDMMENFGWPAASSSVHTPADRPGVMVDTKTATVPVDDEWHVWRMVWSETGLTFAVDGRKYLQVAPNQLRNWVFGSGKGIYLLLNLAVGGRAGAPGADPPETVDMLVDYVRVW